MNGLLINEQSTFYKCIIFFLLIFVVPQNIHSWDIAVADDEKINFFDFNGDLQSTPDEISELNDFYMVAYDFQNDRIFFNVKGREFDIFAYNYSEKALTPLVPRRGNSALGITYDILTETLLWTDGKDRTIWKRSLGNSSIPQSPVLIFETDIPTGIAVSICQRLLFWTNINHLSASIDRSRLDGSDHEKIVLENVFVPLAISVDEVNEKLFWTDDESGIYFKIESSNFDGSDRRTVTRGTNQEPIGIIALKNAIFWTDTIQKKVWKLSTDTEFYSNESTLDSQPAVFYNFSKVTPYGIAAFREEGFECGSAISGPSTPRSAVQPHSQSSPNERIESYCLNSGVLVGKSCRCKKGFGGVRCQVSECHNYCLNGGICSVDGGGRPRCLCPEGYAGPRCGTNLCLDRCLNGGKCIMLNSVATCSCNAKYTGNRCELSLAFMCKEFCEDSFTERVDRQCNSTSTKCYENRDEAQSLEDGRSERQNLIVVALISSQTLTVLVIVVLARKICVLRRRPRIKKRIIINKGLKGQTPMTARPQATSEQCEITIENCCNMNICETPCFEPNLRSSRASSKSLPKKSEDKRNLLKNMEENFENSDVFYS